MDSDAARKFLNKCEAFCKEKAIKKGAIPSIRRSSNRTEWQHWMDYFEFIGMSQSVGEMRRRGEWCVPSLSPMEFDPEIALEAIEKGDRKRAIAREAPTTSLERKRDMVAAARAAMESGTPYRRDETEDFR